MVSRECLLADQLYAALEDESFATRHWEKEPVVVHRSHLARPLAALLTADDLPLLSERMAVRDISPQVRREGMSCEARELCRDFLEGGSIIVNKIDTFWPPIGRLCAALRSRFLHVFAVMYLTPRASRAVPAHSDDQDVLILQLAGEKEWTVYGSPIELPYSHEQLGKGMAVDRASLGEPLLQTVLKPGGVLYLPRGFVHEARANEAGSSLHITLTVQTSDLNWRTFVRGGLEHLYQQIDDARLPLPLDTALGGYEQAGGAREARSRIGGVCEGVYSGAFDCSDPGGAEMASEADAVTPSSSPSGAIGRSEALVRALMQSSARDASRGFAVAMATLTRNLEKLNGMQDDAIAAEEVVQSRMEMRGDRYVGRLPPLLRCPPGISMSVRAEPSSQAAAPVVKLVCTKSGGSMTTSHDERLADALSFMADAARRGAAFKPTQLPACDAFEQVALCSRLLALDALCPARPS